MVDGSYHYGVAAKIRIRNRWEYDRSNRRKVSKVMPSERMDKKGVRK